MALINAVFLRGAPHPKSLDWQFDEKEEGLEEAMAESADKGEEIPVAGIIDVLRIPGLLQYSFSYMFLKLVNYALFFWLPYLLVDSKGLSKELSNDMSAQFDWGFIAGALLA